MIFATILYDGAERVCAVKREDNTFLPLPDKKMTMQTLIEHYDFLKNDLKEFCTASNASYLPMETGALLSPIPYPRRNVVCLGKNYLKHVKEIGGITGGPKDRAPEYPIYFTKAAFPCNHPGGTILLHRGITEAIDYEAELCVVIGKKGINIPVEKAEDYIFGYTIGNDISARDVQNRHVNWFKGKSLTSHCPIGPWIVHKSHFSHPLKLKIQSFVNGELRQDGNTGDLIRSVPEIIADLSKGYELFPGDIIMTGTPAGVGMGFHPPKYMNPGDEIRCVIEGIGELVNYMEND